MSEHTPGPWTIKHRVIAHDGKGGYAVGWGDDPQSFEALRPPGGVPIGREHTLLIGPEDWGSWPSIAFVEGATERQWRDARLIAAAPDLLAVVKRVIGLDGHDADTPLNCCEVGDVVHAAVAAIRKATEG